MKAKIFKYYQNEKDYDSLNLKFRNLQNEQNQGVKNYLFYFMIFN
jgi:hypothetical protein